MDPADRAPFVRFGRETCGDSAAASRREWLLTNGIGGYASTALDGTPLRRYSGWLIAALEPPVRRTLLVGALLERITVGGLAVELGALDRDGGPRDPDGARHLEHFQLDGTRPSWRYAFGGAVLEKTAWMAHGRNTTWVRYRVIHGGPVTLEVTPLVTHRDHHALRPRDERQVTTTPLADGLEVGWPDVPTRLRLGGRGASVVPRAEGAAAGWVRGIRHRLETERGLDDLSDLAVPGRFRVELAAGSAWTLVMSVEEGADRDLDAAATLDGASALEASRCPRGAAPRSRPGGGDRHHRSPRPPAGPGRRPVHRQPSDRGEAAPGRSVIAGYPWFNDWGRDTMIALPGLTLATGRFDDAERILRSFAGWVRDGLLPNSFPDAERAEPAYHTVDAALWYVHAVEAYRLASGDEALVDGLLPILRRDPGPARRGDPVRHRRGSG